MPPTNDRKYITKRESGLREFIMELELVEVLARNKGIELEERKKEVDCDRIRIGKLKITES